MQKPKVSKKGPADGIRNVREAVDKMCSAVESASARLERRPRRGKREAASNG